MGISALRYSPTKLIDTVRVDDCTTVDRGSTNICCRIRFCPSPVCCFGNFRLRYRRRLLLDGVVLTPETTITTTTQSTSTSAAAYRRPLRHPIVDKFAVGVLYGRRYQRPTTFALCVGPNYLQVKRGRRVEEKLV